MTAVLTFNYEYYDDDNNPYDDIRNTTNNDSHDYDNN